VRQRVRDQGTYIWLYGDGGGVGVTAHTVVEDTVESMIPCVGLPRSIGTVRQGIILG